MNAGTNSCVSDGVCDDVHDGVVLCVIGGEGCG